MNSEQHVNYVNIATFQKEIWPVMLSLDMKRINSSISAVSVAKNLQQRTW